MLRFINIISVTTLLFLLEGCDSSNPVRPTADVGNLTSSILDFTKTSVWLEKIHFKVSKNINGNSPVLLHVVIIPDADTLEEFSKLSSQDYFLQVDQLKKDNKKVMFIPFEIIPGQVKEPYEVDTPTKGAGILIFARYRSAGEHRHALADEAEILVHLEKDDFSIEKVA